jgi:hypothetical protein
MTKNDCCVVSHVFESMKYGCRLTKPFAFIFKIIITPLELLRNVFPKVRLPLYILNPGITIYSRK